MIITHVVDEIVARAMFDKCSAPHCPVTDHAPSVKWLVVAEPYVCDNGCVRFDGKVPGWVYGSNWAWVPCQTCMGTMLPDVQIVSRCELCGGTGGAAHNDDYDDVEVDGEFPLLGCGDCDGEGVIVHGVVVLGAAVAVEKIPSSELEWFGTQPAIGWAHPITVHPATH